MFHSFGVDEQYYGVDGLIPQDGFLQPEPPKEEEEEEEDVKPMEQEEKEEEEEQEVLVFGASQADIELDGGGHFRLKRDSVPLQFISIPPNVMKAVSRYDEEMSKQKTSIFLHPCFPGIVHASPLVSLFSSSAVVPAGQKKVTYERAWHNQYTSFVYSAYQLKQLYISVTGGLIPFDAERFTQAKLERLIDEFKVRMRQLGERQDEALDALYSEAIKEGVDRTAIMHRFIYLMEQYMLEYIHLLEYTIWAVAVQPRVPHYPVESILTPSHILPLLSQCIPQEQERIRQDANMFFNYKVKMRQEQEAVTGETADVRPTVPLVMDSVMQASASRYKELIPLRTIYEYFWYLDTDGILTKHGWHWSP